MAARQMFAPALLSLSVAVAGCGLISPADEGQQAEGPPKPKNATTESLRADPRRALETALSEVKRAGSAKFTMTRTTVGGSGRPPEVTRGAISFGPPTASEKTLRLRGHDFVERVIGGVNYTRLSSPDPDGKTWSKMDVAKLTGNPSPRMHSSDPRLYLEDLLAATDLKAAGVENQAVRFTGTAPSRDGETTIEKVTIWVDTQHRPQRIETLTSSIRIGYRYEGFGERVRIVAPPADEVTDMTEPPE